MSPAAPARLHRAARGRADLLRLLELAPVGDLDDLAGLCGFELRPIERPVVTGVPSPTQPQEIKAGPVVVAAPLRAELYAVIESRAGSADEASEPLPSAGAAPLHALPQSDGLQQPPESTPLVPARRMAAFLRRCLRHPGPSQRLDVARWVDLVARGRVPARLPTQRLPGWNHGSGVAFDGDESQQAMFGDMHALAARAVRLGGGHVTAYWCDGRGQWWQAKGAAGRTRWLQVAPPGALSRRYWLMVGDWQVPQRAAAWRKLVAGAQELGGRVHWLQPRSRPFASQPWQRAIQAAAWDHGADLRLRRPAGSDEAADPMTASMNALLASLSLAVRFEPPLLRAVRLTLGLPIEVEAAIWTHPDVDSTPIACQIKPVRVGPHRAALHSHPLERRRELARQVESLHRHLSPLIRMEEAALAADLAPGAYDAGPDRWQVVASTLASAPGSTLSDALSCYVRRAGLRAHPAIWAASPGFAEAWVRAETPALRAGAPLPLGLPAGLVRSVLAQAASASDLETWQLVQQGDAVMLQRSGPVGRQRWLSSFGPFRPEGGVVLSGPSGERWTDVSADGTALAQLEGPGPWKLAAGAAEVALARLERPGWAQSWGFDAERIVAATPPLGRIGVSTWVDLASPLDPQHPLLVHGAPVHLFEADPAVFPGCRLGVDRDFGLFADLAVGPATQRFRWIPPGEFWMGSPEGEPGRYGDESPRHRVRISQGYWLADTACTVALWHAVMEGRPSRAKAESGLPMTEISFDDVQTFLRRLQARLPAGCAATLPTEAEWEYACRAGTETAFHFGARIGRKQVNFDASESSELAEPGESASGAMPVKSLPPNPWGLFEMHGNVWEWCADDWRNYAETAKEGEVLTDPTGPVSDEQEALRALRGGSWFNLAGFARSAFRRRYQRGDRFGNLGFRVALRSTSPEAPEGPQAFDFSPEPEAQGPARRDAGPARSWTERVRDIVKPKPKPKPPPRGGRGKR